MSSASSRALRLLPLAALVASPLALAAEPLKIFSPRLADPEAPIYTTFTAETGIPVELVETSMEAFTDGMRAAAEEGATPPADVLMVVDSANIHRQREAGWFQPLESETLEARVPEALRDLEAGWSGYATRARVIVINEAKLDWVPESYEALTDPRLAGRLCLGGGASAYNTSLVSAMVAHHGAEQAEAWVEGLAANLARPAGGRDGELFAALAAEGDCAVTVANHYYLLRMLGGEEAEQRELAESLTLVWPNQAGEGLEGRGAYRNVAAFAVARGTPNADAARLFLEHTASGAVQQDVAEGIFYPVVEEIGPIEAVAAFGEATMDALAINAMGEQAETAREIMVRAGWE